MRAKDRSSPASTRAPASDGVSSPGPVPAVRWLLSQDSPCLRARTREWLLDQPRDHPEVAGERRALKDDPVLSRLFEAQAADGSWHGRYLYVPKHHSTFHVLGALAEMGADRSLPQVRRATEFALSFQARNGEVYQMRRAEGGRPSAKQPVPCVTARLMAYVAELGYADDERVLRGAEWLLSIQRPDGGWSCGAGSVPRGYVSERPCLGAACCYLALAAAMPGLREDPATLRAVSLVASLYFHDPKGYHMGNTWPQLFQPPAMLDLAVVGRLLLSLGADPAEARATVRAGAEHLIGRRRPDGAWSRDASPYRPPVDPGPGPRSGPNHWVTLRVLRFLKAFGVEVSAA